MINDLKSKQITFRLVKSFTRQQVNKKMGWKGI